MLKEDEISGNYSLSAADQEIETIITTNLKNQNESFESATSEVWNISTDGSEDANDISILSNHNM